MRSARNEITRALLDPSTSDWLKEALRTAWCRRDPVDAANDAEFLAELIRAWADEGDEEWLDWHVGELDDYSERSEG